MTQKPQLSILGIQEKFYAAGYQWEEHIYNDDFYCNCSIHFTISNDPNYFSKHVLGDFGWGRFPRIECWQMANDWLDKNPVCPFIPQ